MKKLLKPTSARFSFVILYLIAFFIMPQAVFAQVGGVQRNLQPRQSISTEKVFVPDLTEIRDDDKQLGGSQGSGFSLSGRTQPINVHVLGDVANPGVFRANISDRAVDIVKSANPNRQKFRIIHVRRPGEKTKVYDLYRYYYYGDLRHNPFLNDNDVVFVPDQKGAVRIEGPVARPGVYELNAEKNLEEIVKLAGGFTGGMSKMKPVKVVRFADGGEQFILDVVQTKSSLKKFKIKGGDIIVVPDIVNAAKKFDYTVESIPGENIVYPTSVADVFVIGAVTQPGPYPYKSHLTIKEYLGYSGAGVNANLKSVYVLRDGKKRLKRVHEKVQAGDVLIVRERNAELFFKYLGIASTIMSFTLSAIVFKDVIQGQ